MHKRSRDLDTLADKLFRRCGETLRLFSHSSSFLFFSVAPGSSFSRFHLAARPAGVVPAWNLYCKFIHSFIVRAFVYSCPGPNNDRETRDAPYTADRSIVTTLDMIDPFIVNCRGRYYNFSFVLRTPFGY